MLTLKKLESKFPTEDSCKQFLKEQRWPNGVFCPRCGNGRVYKLKKAWHWQCKGCTPNGYRFSIITGTVFQNTKYPLKAWFTCAFLILTAKKGISALQIQRVMGSALTKGQGSYETFWYMAHRLRAAMENDEFKKLAGVVEIDETFIGGKEENKPLKVRGKAVRDGSTSFRGKVGVIGAISRKGNVTCQIIENMDTQTVGEFVKKTVSDEVELIATDDHVVYDKFAWGPGQKHESVKHSKDEYVRGVVHTSHIDSYWSLIKRGIMGNFHHVSRKYLGLYLNEFTFRHNNRKNEEVFATLIACA
ncbi:MAG: IS1595 family transposase [Planctomycetaceae bacterium]|nr:IS1595 family transposase [Planctomycetaceae bacterium]